MSDAITSKDRLNILKKRARKISKANTISSANALSIVARNEGYDSWQSCNNAIKNGAPISQQPPTSRAPAPSHDKCRLTLIDYSSEHFLSTNGLRNRIENEIKDSLRKRKGAQLAVKLHLNRQQIEEIGDVDNFFDSILHRFENLQRIEFYEIDPNDSPLLDIFSSGLSQ